MNDMKKAIDILNSGGVVGMPTETVYGLAASIESSMGIENIFKTKERPFFDPLIVHVSSPQQAKTYAKKWFDSCDILTQTFWPGPLTIVLPKQDFLNPMITSGLNSVGLRMPEHPVALELIESLGHPVAAPSANKFKKTSPTSKEHVKVEFDDLYVLDGGNCKVGIESTVVGVFNHKISIYRPGMISKNQIEAALAANDFEIPVEIVESPVAPGQLKHHYMPKLPIILLYDADSIADVEHSQIEEKITENPHYLALETDPTLCARNLYQNFRTHDENASSIIIKIPNQIADDDEWQGIMNRLEKAASFVLSK